MSPEAHRPGAAVELDAAPRGGAPQVLIRLPTARYVESSPRRTQLPCRLQESSFPRVGPTRGPRRGHGRRRHAQAARRRLPGAVWLVAGGQQYEQIGRPEPCPAGRPITVLPTGTSGLAGVSPSVLRRDLRKRTVTGNGTPTHALREHSRPAAGGMLDPILGGGSEWLSRTWSSISVCWLLTRWPACPITRRPRCTPNRRSVPSWPPPGSPMRSQRTASVLVPGNGPHSFPTPTGAGASG